MKKEQEYTIVEQKGYEYVVYQICYGKQFALDARDTLIMHGGVSIIVSIG